MRVKTGTTRHARHKKILRFTRGFRMTKGRLYKVSKEAALHKGQYQFEGRKNKKRDLRRLWISRINAGLKTYAEELSYSRFVNLLKKSQIELDRKMLSDLATNDPAAFKAVVDTAHKAK
ncbi:MAG: 50S ribosomal protein L20 [Candidatus Chisholmbacteria bacterium]|nr:50S ribosomal protein L20 [Candidatus Chisholmbacteria bacterium]